MRNGMIPGGETRQPLRIVIKSWAAIIIKDDCLLTHLQL